MKHTLSLILAMMAVTGECAYASQWGYCTDAISRNQIFRMGESETQGMAIRLDAGKLGALKGHTITGASIVFGSQRTTGGTATLFITTDPDTAPITTQEVNISGAIKWLSYQFDTPYTITGDEGDLYVGYTANISNKSSMLTADYTEASEGCCYVYCDGTWVNTYGLGVGNVSVRIEIADSPSLTDLHLKPIALDGYFKAGQEYGFSGQVLNFGSDTVTSFDLVTNIDGAETTTTYSGLDLRQGQVMDFAITVGATSSEGTLPLSVGVTNINGGADADDSDNILSSDLYYYPAEMERSLLLEGFTGQYCSNCPAGHATINAYLERTTTPVIEVMHHAGYSPDFLTMDCALDYTSFYPNPMSTFAPAAMINRHCVPTVSASPVINVTASDLNTVSAAVEKMQPYVSLDLSTTYDPATRQATVTLRTYAHRDLPSETNILNVMLAQNGIVGYQTPYGTSYEHNAVMRGVLTGNSWGVMLDQNAMRAGGYGEWSTTFTVPEGIFADYYSWDNCSEAERIAYTTPVEIENMYVVAYVAAYEANNKNGHTVYNAVEAPLGQSHTQAGMASSETIGIDTTPTPQIHVVDRKIVLTGEYDNINVYTLTGQAVDAHSTLRPGVYVLCVTGAHGVTTKKVMIR